MVINVNVNFNGRMNLEKCIWTRTKNTDIWGRQQLTVEFDIRKYVQFNWNFTSVVIDILCRDTWHFLFVPRFGCLGSTSLWNRSQGPLKRTHPKSISTSGTHSTNDISFEFKIQPKFAGLWLEMFSTDHNEILYMSRSVVTCAKFHCDQLNIF